MIYPIRVFVDSLDIGVVEIRYPARYRFRPQGGYENNVIFTSFDLKAEWGAYEILDRFLDNGQETMVFQRII